MAKNEKVTAADILSGGKKSEKKPSKKKGKHGYRRTEIEHHPNGSHTVRHLANEGEDTSYAAADLDGVKAGMDDHLGGGPAAGPAEEAGAQPSGLPPSPMSA